MLKLEDDGPQHFARFYKPDEIGELENVLLRHRSRAGSRIHDDAALDFAGIG